MKAAFSHPHIVPRKVYQPQWDVREDESFYVDIPDNGGTLGYRLLKGLQLLMDCPAYKFVAPSAQLSHDMAMVRISVVLAYIYI